MSDSEEQKSDELPDPMELYRRMQEQEGSELPELPDPAALFQQMQQYSESFDSSEVPEDSLPDLPDPRELFEQMEREAAEDDLPHIPSPTEPPAQIEESDEEDPEPGFFQRLRGRFSKPAEEEIETSDEEWRSGSIDSLLRGEWGESEVQRIPTPEELFQQYQQEQAEVIPSPQELFRQMEEEREAEEVEAALSGQTESRVTNELPELPDLEEFKRELEAEERARLDPDLEQDLSGPQRFVDTVSDTVFRGDKLPGFSSPFPEPPEPFQEPAPAPEPQPEADPEPELKPKPEQAPIDFEVPEAEVPVENQPESEPAAEESNLGIFSPGEGSGPTGTVQVSEDVGRTPPSSTSGSAPESDFEELPLRTMGKDKWGRPADPEPEKAPKPKRFKRFSRYKLAVFTRQIAVMLMSGIQLHLTVSFAAESDEELRPMLEQVLKKIESGYQFSAALQEASRTFDPVYIGLIQAGELSGRLPSILSKLADALEREVELRKRLVSAVTYPIVLLAICFLGTLGFIFFILPTLTPLFNDLQVELPLPTRILLASRDFIIPVTAVAAGLSFLFYVLRDKIGDYIKSRPTLERQLAAVPFELPVIGAVYEKIVTARVLYSLSTMLDVGITLNQALARAETAAGNALVAFRLSKARFDLADGVGVTECFRMNNLFTPSALYLISAGEEAARLAEMFKFVARILDEEVEYAVQSASSVLEPLIMVVMGFIVGFITISAALPTIQLLENFS